MGGRPPETSDKEILEIFSRTKDPVLSTGEVSNELEYSQAGTYKRLRQLEEKGWLDSKMLGDVRAWWLTKQGESELEE